MNRYRALGPITRVSKRQPPPYGPHKYANLSKPFITLLVVYFFHCMTWFVWEFNRGEPFIFGISFSTLLLLLRIQLFPRRAFAAYRVLLFLWTYTYPKRICGRLHYLRPRVDSLIWAYLQNLSGRENRQRQAREPRRR